MTGPVKRILFDAHAILKWTQKEQGYQKVKALLPECRNQSAIGYMNQVNVGGVYYKTIRVVGLEEAKKFWENFSRLPISLILPDSNLIWKASEIKAEYSIPHTDCFAASRSSILARTLLSSSMSHLFQIFKIGRLEMNELADGLKGNLVERVVIPAEEDFSPPQYSFPDIQGKLLKNAYVRPGPGCIG